MKSFTLGLLGLASLSQAAQSTTKHSTTTMFIPPAYTGSATNIYASMITEDPTKTLYKLACQSDVAATSYSCKNDFDGVTYTAWDSRVDVILNSTSYGCALFSDRAGVTSKPDGSASAESRTLSSSESSLWMTAVTIVDLKKRKTTKTAPKETGSNKLCKRKVRDHDNGGGDGGSSSGSTGSGSGADDDGDSGSNINKKPNTSNDDCSTASVLSLSWAVVAMGLGGYLGLNLA
ncbi:uncharacterized protein FIESC28_04132 [Fusarium coffeatum]|uniref:AA1-like domain-containing protein n=1 Tax=Fusarium coffeatum TaxID=231269 RepID=A0A366S1C3_9HYPO|nr:uncharacterized protein FIESC28_04132 [Fusarium coffeatum]RBR23137.1 hypothetical protein FIESC28_04132 [Fusarium coffeatum]